MREDETRQQEPPENRPGEPGAEGGARPSHDDEKLPPAPHEDDDSPLGDTDQHSTG
ncbi:MAG: hypothetical protein WBQ18_00250 [Solirubrobacteraceae bacterium]|jgi:hypothetical protein